MCGVVRWGEKTSLLLNGSGSPGPLCDPSKWTIQVWEGSLPCSRNENLNFSDTTQAGIRGMRVETSGPHSASAGMGADVLAEFLFVVFGWSKQLLYEGVLSC